jgi:tellurite resistance protein TerC
MIHQMLPYALFVSVVFVLLLADMGLLRRGKAEAIGVREACLRTAGWTSLAMMFNLYVWWSYGHRPPTAEEAATLAAGGHLAGWYERGSTAAMEFLAGYVVEQALSVDNIFVFVVLFRAFQVPPAYQHKVLFWGILGALFFRAIFIAIGATLLTQFEWMFFVFGAVLILTGLKLIKSGGDNDHGDPTEGWFYQWSKRVLPMTETYRGDRFAVRESGRLLFTPLFLVLLVVETTDIVFAVDSVPAIFAITSDPFIVFTSNVCAILGLRSLYFALAGVMDLFRFLNYGLAFILIFIGMKMLLHAGLHIKVPIGMSLGVIALTLALSVGFSLLFRPAPEEEPTEALAVAEVDE